MFWRMTGLSTASPVETILDKSNFTLEELLDEDEIIQECKALNGRLNNFLREKSQVEQLLRYIVEEAPNDADKKRSLKYPFIACEILTCEVDMILKTVVEDEALLTLLFSFLDSKLTHSMLLAGYFSKVVICLLSRMTTPFMNHIQVHQEIFRQLVELIGITSIMEVLIRLIGVDEHLNTNYMEKMQWLEDRDVLEMIVDKFSSSDSPEVHANAAETLCAIIRCAPPGLSAKISSSSFIRKLFCHALEDSRPKSVLVNVLFVCISLLDPKRLTFGTYPMFNRQMNHGSFIIANPETVEGMLKNLGGLVKLLDALSAENVLFTTYGKLQPPLGKHRLKIVEFISVLLAIGSKDAEKELIRLGAIKRIIDLFFEYPYNNFMHHHVENMIISCLESKNAALIEHLLLQCDLIGKILAAEKTSELVTDQSKPTVPAEGKLLPRIGNIGHLTRISNKLIQFGNNSAQIQAYLQDNSEWVAWQANVLQKRNSVENVHQWACGRPSGLNERSRDSDDDDYQDRDYDVAVLANNLSQAFQYGIYNSDETDEANASIERDDEDVYFDDESAEVVISSLRLGDDPDSNSLFTNSNWFAFEDNRISNEHSTGLLSFPFPITEVSTDTSSGDIDKATVDQENDSDIPEVTNEHILDGPTINDLSEGLKETKLDETDVSPDWVEWRETSDSGEHIDIAKPIVKSDGPNDNDNDVDDNTTVSSLSFEILTIDDDAPALKASELPESGSATEDVKPAEK